MSFKKQYCLLPIALIVLLGACDVFSSSHRSGPLSAFNQHEINSGGAATISQQTFSKPAPNLSQKSLQIHTKGDKNFETNFVTAPAAFSGGLGPLFDNGACNSCHVNDGAGKPFLSDGRISSVLVRLSSNGKEVGRPQPVRGFGTQLQHKAVFGIKPEANLKVSYQYHTVTLADGSEVQLRKPTYHLKNPYKKLPANTAISVRTAPPFVGMGLLEAIPASQVMMHADPNDRDNDGISGKPNLVMNDSTNSMQLGRFGWKANQPTILQQVAIAYHQDMGVTSPYYPGENIDHYPRAQDGLDDDPEISLQTLKQTAFYAKTLGVPAKRNVNSPKVKQGKALFKQAGCQFCHVAHFTTKKNADIPALADQTIFPYTDLLLHDMGEGLADHRADYKANGREWRTAPLWGVGLMNSINGHEDYLHDGRARTILEAILWHGGEAKTSKNFVKQLSKSKRQALIAFVKAL